MTGHLKSWRVCCEDENYGGADDERASNHI